MPCTDPCQYVKKITKVYVHTDISRKSVIIHADQPTKKESFSLSFPMDYRDDRL